MEVIKQKLTELERIVKEHPLKIPLEVAAEFLGIGREGLMAALMRGNVPFGFAYQKQDGGYRVPVIPSVTFYLWYCNTTGQEVMSADIEYRRHPV
ncbi:MAG: hypothetical protein IJX39_04585 [Clostridia bacterium]|nr:hypothetical protein [Clostridia bacterium]MBQ8357066.1 hypothetical protein [Clostridia bacterium]